LIANYLYHLIVIDLYCIHFKFNVNDATAATEGTAE